NLVVALAAGEAGEDLQFAHGQGSTDSASGVMACGGDGDVPLANPLQQFSRDLGGDDRLSGRSCPDGRSDRLGWRTLEDVAAGARDDRLDHAVLLAASEHQHTGGGGE